MQGNLTQRVRETYGIPLVKLGQGDYVRDIPATPTPSPTVGDVICVAVSGFVAGVCLTLLLAWVLR